MHRRNIDNIIRLCHICVLIISFGSGDFSMLVLIYGLSCMKFGQTFFIDFMLRYIKYINCSQNETLNLSH